MDSSCLGRSITEGLGAGNRPERAREAAEESSEEIKALLNDGTKMVFITAGMGGGTGTGAAPVIARIAKEMDILTVGIVTIPFIFEGEKKIIQALDGVERIAQHVDALLVINNERLREIYSDLTFMNAFGKAGDDEDSWKSQFTASGYFDSVDTQISGLGRIEAIQQIYIDHTKDAIDSLGNLESASTTESTVGTLEDGVYTAKFDTDSSMFHVNEADEGRGILTVENGKMTIHISLVSKKIVNLFVGTADDAKKDGADILEPTTDTVKYSDGTTDEVYGFDVPVEALDEEFDLAILGTKGEWYDHKVSVSDPQETDN